MTAIDYIQSHPAVAFIVGVTHLIGALIINDLALPTLLMQIFQLGAWSVTITVGLITIYGFFKKKKNG